MLGGWVDNVIMRATDTLKSIPTLLLVIVFSPRSARASARWSR